MRCRGSIKGLVIAEGVEQIGSDVKRPGHGRGPQSWPTSIEVGAEQVTALSFPTEPYTSSLLNDMENFDASDFDY